RRRPTNREGYAGSVGRSHSVIDSQGIRSLLLLRWGVTSSTRDRRVRSMRFPSRATICVALALGALAVAAAPAAAAGGGAVFTSTNGGSGNSVVAFHLAGD